MAKIDAVIIRRSFEENTIALVSAECDPEMINSVNDLFGAVSRAVTGWTRTPSGMNLLRQTGRDINVADLQDVEDDPELVKELAAWGVTGLTVEVVAGEPTSWDFDDNLYDPAHLEAGDESRAEGGV